METLIKELEEKADHYWDLHKREMKSGAAEWALKYQWMWHGYNRAIRDAEEIISKKEVAA
jgi:hypothetical protein